MKVQTARLNNLRAVIRLLEQDGLASREGQAVYLGRAVTARKLQAMLDGAHIHVLFAEHVEHALFKPRGWMSQQHDTGVPGEADAWTGISSEWKGSDELGLEVDADEIDVSGR
jgi:hypothetical protein